MKKSVLIIVLFLVTACTQWVANINGLEFLHDRRTREDILKDELIEQEAYRKVAALSGSMQKVRVKLRAYNAQLLVTGEAESAKARDKIIANIRIIKNIRIIYNEMLVKPLASKELMNEDAVISKQVKHALLNVNEHADFDETRVKVVVSSKNVYLMGLLYENEARSVAVKIQKIEGIRNIITLFEYIEQESP
ncbi:MAG: BON domain-containing protein [Methyloprofundus sp.]|nr:BON domain-containing protein [Methyloprofundus sp.]